VALLRTTMVLLRAPTLLPVPRTAACSVGIPGTCCWTAFASHADNKGTVAAPPRHLPRTEALTRSSSGTKVLFFKKPLARALLVRALLARALFARAFLNQSSFSQSYHWPARAHTEVCHTGRLGMPLSATV